MNNEIIAAFIGGVVGAALTGIFAIIQRSFEEWRTFQEQIGLIQERFSSHPDNQIEPIRETYNNSIDHVTRAVCRVRPYMLCYKRTELTRLLEEYRLAATNKYYGLTGSPPDPRDAKDFLPDPQKAKQTLNDLLKRMTDLGF